MAPMVEGIKFFDMSKQVEQLKRFGHFEIVVQEELSGNRHNVVRNILPWAAVESRASELHYFTYRFQSETDIWLKTPLWIGHQYAPLDENDGRSIITVNPDLIRIESVTRLTKTKNERLNKNDWKKQYLFMVNPEEGMIIKGRGLTGQEINFEIFWILPGYTFEEMFPGYIESLV